MTDLFFLDFGADTAGLVHLQTDHDLAVFAIHAFMMLGVAFAAVMTL